jgi:hypothetical protein
MSLTMTKKVAEYRALRATIQQRFLALQREITEGMRDHGTRSTRRHGGTELGHSRQDRIPDPGPRISWPRSYLESASASRNARAVPCHELVESKTSWIE